MNNVVGFSQVKSLVFPVFAALGLALGGCAGDDMGSTDTDDTTASTTNPSTDSETSESATTSESETGSTSDGTDTDPTTTTGGAVDYEADIQPIWDARCVAGCHSAGGSKPDVPLGPGDSHGTLVGQPSIQLPSMNMVEPEDTAKSYLWHKLNNAQADVGGSGSSMPLGGMLDAGDLAKVESWINSGAGM